MTNAYLYSYQNPPFISLQAPKIKPDFEISLTTRHWPCNSTTLGLLGLIVAARHDHTKILPPISIECVLWGNSIMLYSTWTPTPPSSLLITFNLTTWTPSPTRKLTPTSIISTKTPATTVVPTAPEAVISKPCPTIREITSSATNCKINSIQTLVRYIFESMIIDKWELTEIAKFLAGRHSNIIFLSFIYLSIIALDLGRKLKSLTKQMKEQNKTSHLPRVLVLFISTTIWRPPIVIGEAWIIISIKETQYLIINFETKHGWIFFSLKFQTINRLTEVLTVQTGRS